MIKQCSEIYTTAFCDPKIHFPKKKMLQLTGSVNTGCIGAFEQICYADNDFLSASVCKFADSSEIDLAVKETLWHLESMFPELLD